MNTGTKQKTQTSVQRRRRLDVRDLHKKGYLMDTQDDGTLICKLQGPPDTAYEGLTFSVSISLPTEYPFKSPSVGFIEKKVFHPNVDYQSGTICLNVLNQEWTPVYNLVSIIDTLLPQLLTYPNPDDPLNVEAAKLLLEDKEAFRARCRVTD